ncbi:helix-turn-helix domain-containing protein [Paludisphaera rhizosphaerae]|uniref:helix-turn-helix domain-containing protein n=1 Tax=Paludisphaera rhizosphaerae TaxID=2711216 RepID=UPI0013EBDC47|nr:helix-turn-helix domain-containing protein [Paludisphaera rhizosphaerae]
MSPIPPLEELLPFSEIAARLGVRIETVHAWRVHRVSPLAAWKLGGQWRTSEAAVQAFMTACTNGVDSAAAPAPTRRRRPQADAEWCEREFRPSKTRGSRS